MDSRSMSMRFPVLDRIKMSAALPHPVPPSPSFLYRVKNAGPGRRGVSPFWIILNPTDRPIATLSNSSSTTTFAAISTRPIPGSRMNFREIPSSPPRNTPYNSLRRNDHSTIRTIAPFFDRTKVFLSSREIADPPPRYRVYREFCKV